jgi:hypothetical protein
VPPEIILLQVYFLIFSSNALALEINFHIFLDFFFVNLRWRQFYPDYFFLPARGLPRPSISGVPLHMPKAKSLQKLPRLILKFCLTYLSPYMMMEGTRTILWLFVSTFPDMPPLY